MTERARHLIDRFNRLDKAQELLITAVENSFDPGPSVEIFGLHADIEQGRSFTAIFQWDRMVTGFTPDDVRLTNGRVLDTVDPSVPDGDTFTFLVHPESSYLGHFHVVVPDGVVEDSEGRPNHAAHAHTTIIPRPS